MTAIELERRAQSQLKTLIAYGPQRKKPVAPAETPETQRIIDRAAAALQQLMSGGLVREVDGWLVVTDASMDLGVARGWVPGN